MASVGTRHLVVVHEKLAPGGHLRLLAGGAPERLTARGLPPRRRHPPAEARRIARKLEFRYSPKPGRWLNMAEAEIARLSRQALDQRLPDADTVCRMVAAWERPRNDARATVTWRFTVKDACRKLRRLYPSALPRTTGRLCRPLR